MASGTTNNKKTVFCTQVQFSFPGEAITLIANNSTTVFRNVDLHTIISTLPKGKVVGVVYLWSNQSGYGQYSPDTYVDGDGLVSITIYNPQSTAFSISNIRLLVFTEQYI